MTLVIVAAVAAGLALVPPSPWLRPRRRYRALSLAAAAVLAGAFFAVIDLGRLETVVARQHWPVTTGEVTVSETTGSRGMRPRVTYRFIVDGVTYQSSTDLQAPAFGFSSQRRDLAQRIVARYPAGREVEVWYDPQDPTQSQLRVAPPWDIPVRLATAIIVCFTGVYFAMLAWRWPAEEQELSVS